jgi:hypothetical protein
MNRPLRLYVYNNEYDVTRTVTLTPSRGWGGDGALGCVLGFGALHRVPPPLNEPTQAPGETLFETARFSNEENRPTTNPSFPQSGTPVPPSSSADFLVPANMSINTIPSSNTLPGEAPPKGTKKARAHHNVSPGPSMDDYFKEGEQKSKELDHVPTSKPAAGLPPPPKAGAGPPKAAKSPATTSENEDG